MATRTFNEDLLNLTKRRCELTAIIAVPTGTTPVLQKWNYPMLGQTGGSARTYSAATVSTSVPLGFPNNYQAGVEGVFSVARTGAGLWTLTLQDNYQRLLGVRGDMSIAGGTANIIQIVENSTLTNMSAAFGSVIGIGLLSSTATLADPTAGASTILRINLTLQDATEP